VIRQVQRSDELEGREHWEAVRVGSRLTSNFRRKYQPMATLVTPEAVIRALYRAGIRCVLMGTYGIEGWRSEPRATQDVDVLVAKKDVRKAVTVLRKRYPKLTVADYPVVTRFVEPTTGKGVLDVMKPAQAIYQMVFRHTIPVGKTHRLPTLEMALASKFAAMVSPRRDTAKKLIDAGDFVDVVRYNRATLDVPKLIRLVEKVYSGGGAEVRRLIEDIDAGRMIQI
jgi:hypothetical protein